MHWKVEGRRKGKGRGRERKRRERRKGKEKGFLLSLSPFPPLPFPTSSFPYLFLSLSFSLRPFVCAKKMHLRIYPIKCIGAVHDRNLPTRSLQVPESYENFLWHRVKVRSIVTWLRHDDERDDDRSHRRVGIMSSLDAGWFRLITIILIQSRGLAMIARWHQCGTMTSQMLARASFSAVCLTIFPFEFRPRTFTIGFYGKNIIY